MILTMELGDDSYDIVIERGALGRAGELLNLKRKVFIVTDSGVPSGYAGTLAAQCDEPTVYTFEQGEASKSIDTFKNIMSAMLEASLGRGDCVAAVGGGVAGDMAGFAAACYMRGIDFYNIPTTLLSQVDSSIGGKTAIDLDGVKNIVGAFYQPRKVIIDPDTLATLDGRQTGAGLAEVIKMAATSDSELFSAIETSTDLEKDISRIITGALIIKRNVVQQDPREHGIRKVLNFGHTIGHAIEAYYQGRYLHGECVAMGMLYMCDPKVRGRLEALLRRYDIPVACDATAQELMPYIKHDKKMGAGRLSVIYVPEIGTAQILDIKPEELTGYIDRAAQRCSDAGRCMEARQHIEHGGSIG